MPNVFISKPCKWFSPESFKLALTHRRRADVQASTSSPSPSRSKDRVQELREVFRQFDEDQHGRISIHKLRASFMSIDEEMGAPEEVEAAIGDLDKDGDGLLDFDEFLSLMERGSREEDLRRAFEAFEVVPGSGRITPRGLQRVLGRLGDERSFEDCEAMIRAYDLDGDGELDFHEFHRMMS